MNGTHVDDLDALTAEWLLLAPGAVIGFLVGRWWAEVGCAGFDMHRAWTGSRNYRKRR